MTFAQIEVFLKVAQVKSFTIAGEELNMTQPAVSHAISTLEKNLSSELFIRSRQGIELTTQGRTIYPMFIEIHKQMTNVYRSLKRTEVEPCTVKVGVLASVYTSILPKAIKLLSDMYPQIEIKVYEGSDYEITDWLQDGTIDVGFVTGKDVQLNVYNVIADEWFVICSTMNTIVNKRAVSMHSLSDQTFIMSTGGCEPLIAEIAKDHEVNLNIKYNVTNIETIIEMVREDIGISIVPKLSLYNKDLSEIQLIPLKPSYFRQIQFAAIGDIHERPELKVLLEHVKAVSNTIEL